MQPGKGGAGPQKKSLPIGQRWFDYSNGLSFQLPGLFPSPFRRTAFSRFRLCGADPMGGPRGGPLVRDPVRAGPPGPALRQGYKFSSEEAGQESGRGVCPAWAESNLDERSQSGPMTATVAEPQSAPVEQVRQGSREVKPKEVGGKLSTVGIRTGSEAGCGGQVALNSEAQRSSRRIL